MKNTEALKSLGATHVLDRNLAEDALVAEVRKITSKPIKFAFDSISSRETQNTSYKLIASGGALLIDNYPEIENVVADKRLAHVLANGNMPATREVSASLFPKIYDLLKDGSIKVSTSASVAGFKSLTTSVAESCRDPPQRTEWSRRGPQETREGCQQREASCANRLIGTRLQLDSSTFLPSSRPDSSKQACTMYINL